MNNNVQALRVTAAYLVVLIHLEPFLRARGIDTDLMGSFGGWGVDIFFVISGFIMVYTNDDRFRSPRQFWLNRIRRIVPLYWTATFLLVFLSLLGLRPGGVYHWNATDLITSLLFIPRRMSNGEMTLFSVGWTLIYEMFFYVIFGLALILRKSFWRVAAVAILFLSLVAAGIFLRPTGLIGWYYTNPIVLEFIFGCLLGLLYSRMNNDLPSVAAPVGVMLVLVGVLLAWCGSGHFEGLSIYRPILFGIPAFGVVAGALILERSGYRCSNRFLLLLGDASYAIYLFHPFILQTTFKVLAIVAPTQSFTVTMGGSLLALAVVAVGGAAIHLRLDSPIQAYLRRRASAPQLLPLIAIPSVVRRH